jgi:protease PrsW
VNIVDLATRFLVSLLPVVLFLLTLIYLDSYKLVSMRTLLLAIMIGCGVALTSLVLNEQFLASESINRTVVSRYVAPAIEEGLKASWIAWLIGRRRIGFLVDAAILGFAVGTGFALIENTYYLQALKTGGMGVWIVRGLGTAVMHGGMTALFGIISKNLFDLTPRWFAFVPGLLVAVCLHSLFNHFVLPPLMMTMLLHVSLLSLVLLAFWQSERSTKRWLGTQMDVDAELLEIINSGTLSESRIGHYIATMKEQFTPEVLVDLLCYLRLHVELAISAKGLLMMRAEGFKVKPPEGTTEKFQELRHLEQSIGRTGKLALTPFLHQSTRDLWQIYHLEQ